MNISLVTSIKEGVENDRLRKEAHALGHNLQIIDPKNLSLKIKNGTIHYPEISLHNPQTVIMRGVLQGVKKTVSLTEHLRKSGIRVFDNALTRLQYSINKVMDLSKLALKEIPVPHTQHTDRYEDFDAIASDIGYPVIIKPINTGKGLGVVKIDTPEELKSYIDHRIETEKPANQLIIQEFVPYLHDLRILVIGQEVFAMRRVPPTGDFRANFSIGGTVDLFEPDEFTRNLAIKALNSIDMSVGGVDILITDRGLHYVLEVNHSPGFEGMEKATGRNIANLYLTHALETAQ